MHSFWARNLCPILRDFPPQSVAKAWARMRMARDRGECGFERDRLQPYHHPGAEHRLWRRLGGRGILSQRYERNDQVIHRVKVSEKSRTASGRGITLRPISLAVARRGTDSAAERPFACSA